MNTIRAIFENGVFRPLDPVDLPESAIVEFEPRLVTEAEYQSWTDDEIYRTMSERYDSGESDVAARHNEHQP